jgi:hypothetical protein
MLHYRREESVLPSTTISNGMPLGTAGTIRNQLRQLPCTASATITALGGRKRLTKAILAIGVIHCLMAISSNQHDEQVHRAMSAKSSSNSAFGSEKTLPLELMQAIQQAGLASDSSTPASELTSDTSRSMAGAALHGGPTTADSLSSTKVARGPVGQDVPDPSEIPEAASHETAFIQNLTPGDPRDEEQSDGGDVDGDADSERNLGVFKLFGKSKEGDGNDSQSMGDPDGASDGSSEGAPDDASYLLHNLDPAEIQNMDAATLQKVLEVNHISPSVLPQFGSSDKADAVDEEEEVEMEEEEDNESPSSFEAAPERTSKPRPKKKETREDQQGFLGHKSTKKNSSPFKPYPVDDPGTTVLDGPSFDPKRGGDKEDMRQYGKESRGYGKDAKVPPPPQCVKAPRIPAPKQIPVRPTMNASYPGSGARLSWKLIRAITGLMTSDDAVDTNDLSKQGLVVSIKSHYPAHGSSEELFRPFYDVDRSVLLIRNPLKSMPSFLSYLYEQENGLENHSTRVPLEQWIEWRDENFHKELQSWVQHTLFWMEHNKPEDTLIMSYEKLIDAETGPKELWRLGLFLEESSGERLVQEKEDIPCVWDYVVNNRGDTSVNGKTPQSLRKGPKVFPYTDEQIDTMVHYLGSLGKIYPEQLGPMMDQYVVDTLAMKSSPQRAQAIA